MFDRSLCLREALIRSSSRFVTKPIFMPFCDVGDAVFSQQKGFSKAECFVFSAKGAFPSWNAPFSQQKGLFQSGMLRFLSKRDFSKAECFIFSAKGTFPKRNAPFSQQKGLFQSGMLHFLSKRDFSKAECFVFSENELSQVGMLHFLRKREHSCEASFSQKKGLKGQICYCPPQEHI